MNKTALLVSCLFCVTSTSSLVSAESPLLEQLADGQSSLYSTITKRVYRGFLDTSCSAATTTQQVESRIIGFDDEHHGVITSTIINASAESVWEVLTDFDSMSEWSTSFIGLEGEVFSGGQAVANFIFDGDVVGFPHALIYQEGKLLGWSDPIGGPLAGLGFSDNHIYRVEAISPCQTLFIQTDEVFGNHVALSGGDLAQTLLGEYLNFNQQLKVEVESRYSL